MPTVNAGASSTEFMPRIRMARDRIRPGTMNASTARRITGKDCHQDKETPLSTIRDGYC